MRLMLLPYIRIIESRIRTVLNLVISLRVLNLVALELFDI